MSKAMDPNTVVMSYDHLHEIIEDSFRKGFAFAGGQSGKSAQDSTPPPFVAIDAASRSELMTRFPHAFRMRREVQPDSAADVKRRVDANDAAQLSGSRSMFPNANRLRGS